MALGSRKTTARRRRRRNGACTQRALSEPAETSLRERDHRPAFHRIRSPTRLLVRWLIQLRLDDGRLPRGHPTLLAALRSFLSRALKGLPELEERSECARVDFILRGEIRIPEPKMVATRLVGLAGRWRSRMTRAADSRAEDLLTTDPTSTHPPGSCRTSSRWCAVLINRRR